MWARWVLSAPGLEENRVQPQLGSDNGHSFPSLAGTALTLCSKQRWSLLQTEPPISQGCGAERGDLHRAPTTGGNIDLLPGSSCSSPSGWGWDMGCQNQQSAGCPAPLVGPLLLPFPRTDLKLQLCPRPPKIPSLFFSGSSLGRDHTGGSLTQTIMATALHQRSSSSHSPVRLALVGFPEPREGLAARGRGCLPMVT